MPIGCYSLVPFVAHHIAVHRPARVLDLGIGLGSYGAVVRQWGDLGERPWRTYLVVVDSIQSFLSEHHGQFDLVLLTDVIEHFERSEGQAIVEQLQTEVVAPG